MLLDIKSPVVESQLIGNQLVFINSASQETSVLLRGSDRNMSTDPITTCSAC